MKPLGLQSKSNIVFGLALEFDDNKNMIVIIMVMEYS